MCNIGKCVWQVVSKGCGLNPNLTTINQQGCFTIFEQKFVDNIGIVGGVYSTATKPSTCRHKEGFRTRGGIRILFGLVHNPPLRGVNKTQMRPCYHSSRDRGEQFYPTPFEIRSEVKLNTSAGQSYSYSVTKLHN